TAGVLPQHLAGSYLRTEKISFEVGVNNLFPTVVREIFRWRYDINAGIVDEHIYPAEASNRLVDETLTTLALARVGHGRGGFSAASNDVRRHTIHFYFCPRADHHGRPGGCQAAGDGSAQAPPRAGNDGDPVR